MVLSDKVVLFQNTLWVDAWGKYPTMLGFRLSTLCFTSRGRLLRCLIFDPLLPCHFDLHLDHLRESSINEFMLVKNILGYELHRDPSLLVLSCDFVNLVHSESDIQP